MWRVPFQAGTLTAISRSGGKQVLKKEISTAGAPAKIVLTPDKQKINYKNKELSFVTVSVTDRKGNIVPLADNQLSFRINGPGVIAGLDNGNPLSHEMFKGNSRKAFGGLALAVIQPTGKGEIALSVTSNGLQAADCVITAY